MKHILYKTVRPTTGEYYYGIHSTNDLYDGYQGSGTRIKNLLNKGEHLITGIVHQGTTRDEISLLEYHTVTPDMLLDPLCLNIVRGGGGVKCVDISDRISNGLTSRSDAEKAKHRNNIRQSRLSETPQQRNSRSRKRLATINLDTNIKDVWVETMRQSNKTTWDNKTQAEKDAHAEISRKRYASLSSEEKAERHHEHSRRMKGRIWVVNKDGVSFFVSSLDDPKLTGLGPWRRGKKWNTSIEL